VIRQKTQEKCIVPPITAALHCDRGHEISPPDNCFVSQDIRERPYRYEDKDVSTKTLGKSTFMCWTSEIKALFQY